MHTHTVCHSLSFRVWLPQVEHAIKYPEESNGRDQTVLDPLRKRLRELQGELAHRAGTVTLPWLLSDPKRASGLPPIASRHVTSNCIAVKSCTACLYRNSYVCPR